MISVTASVETLIKRASPLRLGSQYLAANWRDCRYTVKMIGHHDEGVQFHTRHVLWKALPKRFDDFAPDRIIEQQFALIGHDGDKVRTRLRVIVLGQANGMTLTTSGIIRDHDDRYYNVGRAFAIVGARQSPEDA